MIHRTTNASLLPYNTFGISERAAEIIEYDSVDDLFTLAPMSGFLHVGRGSNLLFTKPYEGTMLHSRIRGYETTECPNGSVAVRIGAGETWDDIVERAVADGLCGIENLSLIPGEVGSAAVQNIGAYGAEAADVIESVEAIDMSNRRAVTFSNADCKYSYRQSIFKLPENKRYIITAVTLLLKHEFTPNLKYGGLTDHFRLTGENVTLRSVRNAVVNIRRNKLPDPNATGNAGSFFTNPVVNARQARELSVQYPDIPTYPTVDGRVKLSAGWLIDKAGWKGRNLGPAGVWPRQALVLTNLGNATGSDIVALSDAIRTDVKRIFGIDLIPEVNIL